MSLQFKSSEYQNPYSNDDVSFENDFQIPSYKIHAFGFIKPIEKWNHPEVFSPFWRLYYNVNEGAHIHFENTKLNLDAKKIYLIPSNLLFNCANTQTFQHLWIHFELPKIWRSSFHAPIEIVTDAEMILFLDSLTNDKYENLNKNNAWYLGNSILNYALFKIKEPLKSKRIPPAISKLYQYIEGKPEYKENYAQLAQKFSMSERNMSRLFKNHYGLTLNEFAMGIKLNLATKYLRDGTMDIESIAEKCGFSDRFHFSKVFKKKILFSPAAFRKKWCL